MKRVFTLPMVVLLLALGAGMAPAQSGYDLFQKALVKERAEGNIQEAIQLYQRIVREHAGNQALVAKALVEMGKCYEKLGKGEARKAYEQVLRDYAGQQEAVAEARARLAALSPPPNRTNGSAMVARRVWAGPDVDLLGSPFPDGRQLTYVDWETGDLAVRDLATGQKRRLTNKGTWSENPSEFALSSVVSPDGKQVAYNWYNKENFADLRLLPLDGAPDTARPRIVYSNEETGYIQPADWSPDGKQILSLLQRKDGTSQMVMVSAADGSVSVLKSLDWRYPQRMRFSPDGRYIVYDFPPKETQPERDIFLLAADGSREIALVQHPANDFAPFWAPDGTRVVFGSDRTGSMGLWAIRVSQGKPQGAPELIKPEIGRAAPLGFTRNGSLYYGLMIGGQDVYLAELDLTTGKVVPSPVAASQRFVGANQAPDWSPDGEHLAYFSQRGPVPQAPGSLVVVVRSLKTGEEREFSERQLSLQLPRNQRPRWSPDGRSFLVFGRDNKGRRGIYRVDAQTGEVKLIVQSETGVYAVQPNWLPGGKAILYSRSDRKSQRFLLRDMETGAEKEIYQVPGYTNNLALSPDGSALAFKLSDPTTRSDSLMLMPAAGGNPRELLRLKAGGIWYGSLEWSRDGRDVLFVKTGRTGPEERPTLWSVSVEGGEARRLELTVDKLRSVRFHPDGRRIAIDAGEDKKEVWVMENFLPALRAAR